MCACVQMQTADMIDSGENMKGVCVCLCLCDPELCRRETITARLQTEGIVPREEHLSAAYVDTEGKGGKWSHTLFFFFFFACELF